MQEQEQVQVQGQQRMRGGSELRDRTIGRMVKHIMRIGDSFIRNGELSIAEMETYLMGTDYEPFVLWLRQRNSAQFRSADGDHNGVLSRRELHIAVEAYLLSVGATIPVGGHGVDVAVTMSAIESVLRGYPESI